MLQWNLIYNQTSGQANFEGTYLHGERLSKTEPHTAIMTLQNIPDTLHSY